MNKALQVRNWDLYFENSESRKIKNCAYFCMPNKHDGKGYARIAAHAKSCQVFTGWTLILQVASKMPQRGLLVDEDGALDVDDLAAMTRFKSEVFDLTIKATTDLKVRWLEWVDIPQRLVRTGVKSGQEPEIILINQDNVLTRQDEPGQRPGVPGRTEQKGTEQKGTVLLEAGEPPPCLSRGQNLCPDTGNDHPRGYPRQ